MSHTAETHRLLEELVLEQLERRGLPLSESCRRDTSCNSRVLTAMRELCDELRQKQEPAFTGMLSCINAQPDRLPDQLNRVMTNLFTDQTVNWGRIAALVTFCAVLAEDCVRKEMPNLVPRIIGLAACFIDTDLRSWINSHGGWNGLAEFHCPSTRKQWPSLTDICTFTAGAVGVFTVALFAAKV